MASLGRIHLQLFSQEKTEEATPRRRQEARRKGQVYKSQELSSAFLLVAVFSVLYLVTPYLTGEFETLFVWALALDPGQVSEPASITAIYFPALIIFARLTLPVFGVVVAAGLAVNYLQVGFVISGEPLRFKPERLNPVEGIKRIFSRRALVQLVKSVAKLVVVIVTCFFLLRRFFTPVSLLALMELEEGIRVIGELALRLGITVGVVLLVIGLVDLYYQRWEHERSLRMSKQEVKDEMKQVEGDPQLRARVRERQRRMAARRMMDEVPKANVVITNPVHFAVALKYEPEEMAAPLVVAKGKGYLALRIKEVAAEHEVAVVENQPLAQGLYWGAEIGEEIPPDFYQAVAEVLAFIYQLKDKH